MQSQTAKQEAIDAIQRLPDSADTEEIMYRRFVLENIRRGQRDAWARESTLANKVLKDIQTW